MKIHFTSEYKVVTAYIGAKKWGRFFDYWVPMHLYPFKDQAWGCLGFRLARATGLEITQIGKQT